MVITFPITFTKIPGTIGCGFVIEGIGRQDTVASLSTLTLTSHVRVCGSNGWLCIGS